MKLRKIFASHVATAALAWGMVQGAMAGAAEPSDPASSSSSSNIVQKSASAPASSTSFKSFQLNPLVPVGVVAGVGGVYAAFCLYAARRRMKGAWWRATAGAALTATLLNPEIMEEERQALPTEVVIVVDKSASQSLDNRDKMTASAYEATVRQLSAIPGVNIHTIDAGVTGGTTDLFKALETGLTDVPYQHLGAVIMMTDGQVHDAPANGSPLDKTIPVHALISGRENDYDRRIVIEQSPRFGMVNKEQTITFRVVEEGGGKPGLPAQVNVTGTVGGKQFFSQPVIAGQPTEVKVNITHAGPQLIELKVDRHESELTDINNRIVTSIEGIRQNLSVLLVTGEPNPGMRQWRSLLKSNPDTDLVHFTFLRTGFSEDITPAKEKALVPFPVDELFSEKLSKFDLIIFDQYKMTSFLPDFYFSNIAQHVKSGGSLLVVADDYSVYRTPLGAILPAVPDGRVVETLYTPQISEQGKRHPVTRMFADAPAWGRWTLLAEAAAQPGAHVVMEGANKSPLLVLSRQKEGRVAVLQSDSLWLWARGYEGGGPYAELIQQITHWMLRDPALEEEALRMNLQDGKVIVELQTMADQGAPVTISSPSGKSVTVTPAAAGPGLWRAEVPADEVGLYSAAQGDKKASTAFVNVGPPNSREFVNTVSTPDLLKPVADATKGKVARMANAGGTLDLPRPVARESGQVMAGSDWMGIRMTEASILKSANRMSLIPAWLGFLAVVGALAAAWYREGDGKLFNKKKAAEDQTPAPPTPQ